ncbi:MAG: thioredoxin family protein [Ruminococcus sp.]|nr:thioredoxin family protein [Ruminococcus sp.]
MKTLNTDNFDEHKDNMVVLFYANWCPLCIILLDELRLFEEKSRERIKIIDFDENNELAKRFNITGVPTAIAFRNGQIADVRPGFRETVQYREMINML